MRTPRVIPGVTGPMFDAAHERKYGLRKGELSAIWEAQGRVCLICGDTPRTWTVDHDHETARRHGHFCCRADVRGLICANCNSILGMARDRAEVLERAASYLRAWAAR